MLSCQLVSYSPDDEPAVRALVARLGDWFDADAWDMIAPTLGPDTTLLAVDERDRAVGFVVVTLEGDAVGRVRWAGVDPNHHRGGVGRALFEAVTAEAADAGLTELRVETVSESVAYVPFDRTRAFYQAFGFSPVAELGDHAGVGLATTEWAFRI